jgi:NTP pyrophosphatase (non-canonical NTP hydrolase)
MSERDDLTEQAFHQPPVTNDKVTIATLKRELREARELLVVRADHAGRLADELVALRAGGNTSGAVQILSHNAETGLDFMLGLQGDLEDVWGRRVDPADPEAVSTYVREVVLCAEDELHEVLAEVHWKPWKDSRGIKDRDKYREEMADVLHFVLDLYLAGGITGREIIADYLAKNNENLGRNKSAEYRAS